MFNSLLHLYNNLITIANKKNNEKTKVYVIGNGWGSYYFTKNLDKTKYEPVIIAPNLKVLNTPRLTDLITNSNAQVEFENPHGKIIQDSVENIDIKNKQIITKSGIILPYKYVVLSIGSEPNDFGIEGVNTHTYKFKTIPDANLIREKLLNSNLPNKKIYIIGSGITGVEVASKIANMTNQTNNFNVKIIECLETIMLGFNNQTKNIIHNNLLNDNIQIETNTMVKSINNNIIKILKTKTNSIEELKFDNKNDIIIWSCGVRFNGYGKSKLYQTLNKITPIKPRGIEVQNNFSIGENLNIYCIGDMVANKGPSSAQNAKIQGEWLAKYFNSKFDDNFLQNNQFESISKGKLVHLSKNIYMESEYYSGYVPKFIDKIIELINL